MIDAHIHVFPLELACAPRTWALSKNELQWADTVAPLNNPTLQGWASIDDCLLAMDGAGIEKSILLGWYWQQSETCDWHNALMADWQQQHPDRFRWFAAMPMTATSTQLQRCLQQAQNLGACGIGELHPGIQQFDYQSENWRCLSEYCTQRQWPINLHVTDPHGRPYAGRVETPLAGILEMLRQHPEQLFILAHLAGGMVFDTNISLPKNCLFDLAAMPWLYSPESLQQAINNGYAAQICFGSDFPLRLYPQMNAMQSLQRFVESISRTLPREILQAVTRENIQRFIGKALNVS